MSGKQGEHIMNHIEIKFNAITSNIAFARTSVCAFIAPLNPTLEEIAEIKTIVSEAVSNAIIHGYRQDAKRYVFLKASYKEQTLEIIIQDYGVGIENIEKAMTPLYTTNSEEEHAGMGITIMQSLSDDFSIKSTLGLGTKIYIQKSLTNSLVESIKW